MDMDFVRLRSLEGLQEALGYSFKDISLLDQALTHTSYVKGDGIGREHNERLEFLGDAVLELCVSELLYNGYPKLNEGAMTRARAMTVCEGALYKIACSLGIGGRLKLGHGEDHSGGRDKPSILSDALEAVIGAVYLDGGFEEAGALVGRLTAAALPESVARLNAKDYKTALQEHVQKKHLGAVAYELIEASGPDHKKTFVMEVKVAGRAMGRGSGASKQEAGQQAARAAMEELGLTRGSVNCD